MSCKGFSISALLGIDVGGTKVALALGDRHGRLLAQRRRATEPSGDPERDLARIADDARALVREAGLALEAVEAVGVALPGPLDPERELVLSPPNLPGWNAVPVREVLAHVLGRPVHIENDANAAALAEGRFGAARGLSSFVFLTMSTGVGGGVVLGGRLVRGKAWCAGEIGHAPVEWEGEPCKCGQRGCLEAYVGGAAWTRRLRSLAPPGSRVAQLAGARERVTPEHVVAAAREGDAFARQELGRYNDYLSRAIVILAFTLDPEAVVLGTIPSAAGEELCLAPVRERVRAHLWPIIARGLRIVPSGLGAQRGEYAGICVALEALERGAA